MATLLDKASIIIPKGAASKASVLYATSNDGATLIPISTVQNTANLTRINEAGLIEAVDANVLPRDFTNGGCGDTAIWPQRTNIFLRSNEIDNASWAKGNSGGGTLPVVTANYAISPDGTNNADRVQFSRAGTAATDRSFITQTVTGALNTNYSNGVWLKSNTGVNQNILILGNFGTGSVKIVTVTNQWQRFQANLANTGGSTNVNITVGLGFTVMSETSADILVSYVQGEAGDYPSANIKTEGSTETRDAMVPSKTSASALIGQASGGIYFEIAPFTTTESRISLSDGTDDEKVEILLDTNITLDLNTSAGTDTLLANLGTVAANTWTKIIARYLVNNIALHQNGVQLGENLSGAVFSGTTLNTIQFAAFDGSTPFYGRFREMVIFDDSPTQAESNSIT